MSGCAECEGGRASFNEIRRANDDAVSTNPEVARVMGDAARSLSAVFGAHARGEHAKERSGGDEA